MPRLDLDRLFPKQGSSVRTGLREPGRDFPDDPELQLIVDVLTSRGFHKADVVLRLKAYQGDLWTEVFGPAMDDIAEKLGLEP